MKIVIYSGLFSLCFMLSLSSVAETHANLSQELEQRFADKVFYNAVIYKRPDAEAIAIADGKISFIGSEQDVQKYISAETKVINLDKAFIMPGFVDNHNHVFEAASSAGGHCEVGRDASLTEQMEFLIYCRQKNKTSSWIMGYGFTLENILNNNTSTPLKTLDSIFPNKPVVIMEQTSHSMWVNSAALKLAGINKSSIEPQGGKYLKDKSTGELNGILLDSAGDKVMELAWNSMTNKFNQSYDGLRNGLNQAAMHGITTIGDGRLYWQRGWFDVWLAIAKTDNLTARVSIRPWVYPNVAMAEQLKYFKSIYANNLNELLQVNQVKMYSDGIIINGTAKLLSPYHFTYITEQPKGLNYIPADAMKTWLAALKKIGYGAHIHVIGDGAVQESLNAIQYLRGKGSKLNYTLTHVEMVNQSDLNRFLKLNVTADFQVGSDYIAEHDHSWAIPFLGKERSDQLMPIGKLYKKGVNISLSSDWNVHSINPLEGIANSLIMGHSGLPDIYSAIDAYTINPAESMGLADITGSLSIGKSADLAILNRDITKLRPEDIKTSYVLMTLLQGEQVYINEEDESEEDEELTGY